MLWKFSFAERKRLNFWNSEYLCKKFLGYVSPESTLNPVQVDTDTFFTVATDGYHSSRVMGEESGWGTGKGSILPQWVRHDFPLNLNDSSLDLI